MATSLRQARLFVQAAHSVVAASPLLKGMIESVSDDEIRFRNRTALSAFPCTARGVRGWPISTLLFDEAAHFISDTEGPQVADTVFAALVPATAQFGDDARILVCSTPYGTDGFFARLHQQAASGELVDAHAEHAITAEVNPTIDAEFLAREQLRDPDTFRSEYLAEFVGGGHAYLDAERIADAVTLSAEGLDPDQGLGWVAGLDPAFSSDPFGLAIVGQSPLDWRRLVVGRVASWRPSRRGSGSFDEKRASEDAVLRQVAAVCRTYRVSKVVTDQYAAPQVVERLRREGLYVMTHAMTASTKTAVFGELRARLTSARSTSQMTTN